MSAEASPTTNIAPPEVMRYQPPQSDVSTKLVQMSEQSAMLAMIERVARDPSIEISRLERLMDMRRQMEQDAAKRAFIAAKADAKAEIPPIRKNRHVGFESKGGGAATDYWHEDLAEIARTIDPILTKHGLDYSWKTEQAPGKITVHCILKHRDGHEETATLSGPEDDSGKKNGIQRIVSAKTYLERATLKSVMGLSSSREDDDGRGGDDQGAKNDMSFWMTDEQLDTLRRTIVEVGADIPKFLKYYKIERVDDLPAEKYDSAIATLRAKVRA